MYSKHMPDDMSWALVSDTNLYPCGYEIHRAGFTDKDDATKACEQYAKTGKWPNNVKPDNEVDV